MTSTDPKVKPGGKVTPLQDAVATPAAADDLARLKALIERYGPEAIIKVATDAKAALPSLPHRKFEQFKIEVDYLLPSLLARDDLLEEPPYQTIVAAIAQLRPELGEYSHFKLAKRYQQYRRRAGAKRGIRIDIPVQLG